MNCINSIKSKVLNGYDVNFEEARELYNTEDVEELFKAANEIREKFLGKSMDLCSIMNVRCGKCSEDCKYCAQSSYYNTHIKSHDLVNYNDVLELAKENERKGVQRFSLVSSGKALKGEKFEKILIMYRNLIEDTDLKLCASLGILSYEQLVQLKAAGVSKYHHNIETGKNYFNRICTTHTYEDRINTIENAQRAGFSICSGGIIGMGESVEDRVDMALELRRLKITSIPINILMPIKGTPFENLPRILEKDIMKTIAIFRFINREAHIRLAGGRMYLEKCGKNALMSGASATITGDYLTTSGNKIIDDIEMIKELGLEV